MKTVGWGKLSRYSRNKSSNKIRIIRANSLILNRQKINSNYFILFFRRARSKEEEEEDEKLGQGKKTRKTGPKI